jgi:hypothetical protein
VELRHHRLPQLRPQTTQGRPPIDARRAKAPSSSRSSTCTQQPRAVQNRVLCGRLTWDSRCQVSAPSRRSTRRRLSPRLDRSLSVADATLACGQAQQPGFTACRKAGGSTWLRSAGLLPVTCNEHGWTALSSLVVTAS